jgi:hypothetical protein
MDRDTITGRCARKKGEKFLPVPAAIEDRAFLVPSGGYVVKGTWVLNAKRSSHPSNSPFFSVSAILSNWQKSVKSVDLTPIGFSVSSFFFTDRSPPNFNVDKLIRSRSGTR